MAGVNFMALAEGMMLGDKLNKEDETYWRKQAKEDRDMMYQERDQAYKEQTQGYALDDYKEKAETVEASRFISQASDILSAAAKAQGKQKWQVMLESPEFTLPGGSATLQSKVQSGIRAGLVATEAMNLRARGDLKNAERLEQHYGMSQRSDVGAMQAYSDSKVGMERVNSMFPGSTLNDKGNFIIRGQEVPYDVAVGLTFNPAASGATMINQYKVNEQAAAQALAAQQGQTNQAQIQQINTQNADVANRESVRQALVRGYPEEYIASHLRDLYRTMKAASTPIAAGSPPITASVDAATAAPTSAPATPAAIKSVAPVTTGVSPTGGVTTRTAAPASTQPPADQWRDVLLQANKAQAEVDTLEAQRAALKKDLSTMGSLAGRKHFDPATIANARRQLLELNSLLSLKSTELDSLHAQVRQAPVARPGYVNILNDKYKVK
jgi:hypothetical protein